MLALLPAEATTPALTAATRGTLKNLAKLPRTTWTPIALPAADPLNTAVEAIFLTDRGLRLRAVRCEGVGSHSMMWRISAPFDADQAIEGSFTDPVEAPTAPLKLHRWVIDDPRALIPRVRIRSAGKDYETAGFDELKVEFENSCMQRWHFKARMLGSGFLVEGWVTFYHDSPAADVRLVVIWSDRTVSQEDIRIDGLALLTGEFCRFDFALRNGSIVEPAFTGDGWANVFVGAPLGFIDGSGLPLIGTMLCLPQDPGSLPFPLSDSDAEDIATLLASKEAPCWGVATNDAWKGRWMVQRNAGAVSGSGAAAASAAKLTDFFDRVLMQPAGFYAPRPIGVGGNAGATGDQGFSASKGMEAIVFGDPRWIQYALYSVTADLFRGTSHYETDGSRLNPSLHPQWTTYGQVTHWNLNQSPDRIGKAPPVWGSRFSTGWNGMDEEHLFRLDFWACYALTGDPLLRYMAEQTSTADYADIRFRRNYGTGATRAVGRKLLDFACAVTMFDAGTEVHQRYLEIGNDVKRQFLRDWIGGSNPHGLDIHQTITDPRLGVTWNGATVPAWSGWQHGLLLVGVYAWWKVTKDLELLDVVRRASRTLLTQATFKDATGWQYCSAIAYVDPQWATWDGAVLGQFLPRQYYAMNSTLVNAYRAGTETWIYPGLLIFVETHDATDVDMAQGLEVAASFTSNQNATTQQAAEWWSVVRAIPPAPGDFVNY